MKKLVQVWRLTDPFPNYRYEIGCYLTTFFGLNAVILGTFLLLSSWLRGEPIIFGFAVILGPLGRAVIAWEEVVFGDSFIFFSLLFGTFFVLLGLWLFWQIKLVRKLVKTLRACLS